MLSEIILTQNYSIKLFSINNMVLIDLLVNFLPTELLKHSRKGKRLDKVKYRWCEDKTLCNIACLKGYTSRQNKHEGLTADQLIIFLRKPFKEAFANTMRK